MERTPPTRANQTIPAALQTPIAQAMLKSKNVARVGYVAADGTPRVTPVWFHWNGEEIVIGSEPDFKVKSIMLNPQVAISIDDNDVPYRGLRVRGRATVDMLDDFVPELAEAAKRYLGDEPSRRYVRWARGHYSLTVRIAIRPEWARATNFEEDFREVFPA